MMAKAIPLREQKRARIIRQHEEWEARKTSKRGPYNYTKPKAAEKPKSEKERPLPANSNWSRYLRKEITLDEFYDLVAGLTG
jgi:hypothetical protein